MNAIAWTASQVVAMHSYRRMRDAERHRAYRAEQRDKDVSAMLRFVEASGPMTCAKLAREMRMSNQRMTAVINFAERDGLITTKRTSNFLMVLGVTR